eukprot:1187598-Prorocentrum_minimum.AAC.3
MRDLHAGSSAEDIAAKIKEATEAEAKPSIKETEVTLTPVQPGSTLFVGNLPLTLEEAALREMFPEESYGTLHRCFLVLNKEGLSKGYGFVEFDNYEVRSGGQADRERSDATD